MEDPPVVATGGLHMKRLASHILPYAFIFVNILHSLSVCPQNGHVFLVDMPKD